MTPEEKEQIIETLQALILSISDGSIISNNNDIYLAVESMFDN